MVTVKLEFLDKTKFSQILPPEGFKNPHPLLLHCLCHRRRTKARSDYRKDTWRIHDMCKLMKIGWKNYFLVSVFDANWRQDGHLQTKPWSVHCSVPYPAWKTMRPI